eukprot:CAMPEP_0183293428 /NCGR_PEP_ID=MMETSP0160_2-20130417/2116_1 /TAXON_ID=2839 ORGANISM="Odontella Sinensis, Strain Grunow 1884" /NCGR_SAMPLE_ID=MMETSP0160_2 /ASSEMBLY_ACC=CAM_ASM_000250 /LENGTH=288 /DNA_ID=CAMNT_0025454543 /DNA_START=101 /DNA_END=967 /DNA_ORIENTATION=-
MKTRRSQREMRLGRPFFALPFGSVVVALALGVLASAFVPPHPSRQIARGLDLRSISSDKITIETLTSDAAVSSSGEVQLAGSSKGDFVLPPAGGFYVRKGKFSDLRAVADIFMDAFYEPNSIMYHYHRMLELDRIQNNFPYDDKWHDFFVACSSSSDDVVAFVDVDARPSNRRDAPPRPYLSDLAVRKEWRRKGIATHLVVRCEEKTKEMGYDHMYLRVEQSNDAALNMYEKMDYVKQDHPFFGVKDTTTLLRGELSQRRRGEELKGEDVSTNGQNLRNMTEVLDFVV